MNHPLSAGGFKWVDDVPTLRNVIEEHSADSPTGYILEVDLEYPEKLHETHNAYPLAPGRMIVQIRVDGGIPGKPHWRRGSDYQG